MLDIQNIIAIINGNPYLILLTNIILVSFLWVIVNLKRKSIIDWLKKKASKTDNTIDDNLFGFGVIRNIILLIPVIAFTTINKINPPIGLIGGTDMILSVITPVILTMLVFSILNVVDQHFKTKSIYTKAPFYAGIQLTKIIIVVIAVIIIIAKLMGQSPVYILSGLGAATAIIMLIFKDLITGFVSGIHLATNKMVSKGDWITMPSKGVDGDVMEVGIATVKVRNFDKTITSVPSQQLTSNVFFNWKGMQNSGGRRIKRNILIDAESVKLLSEKEIKELKQIRILNDYLTEKGNDVDETNSDRGVFIGDKRSLTNIGTFRAYIQMYLKERGDIHVDGFTFLIRQLEGTEHGVPLQLYVFTKTVNWIEYEGIQSDIFDHLISIAKVFKLKIYQRDNN